MNNKTVKRLKAMVRSYNLPKSIVEVHVKEYIEGVKLYKEVSTRTAPKATKEELEAIDVTKRYSREYTTVKILNVEDEAKEFYLKFGEHWQEPFLKWFGAHHTAMMKKYPSLFKSTTNE